MVFWTLWTRWTARWARRKEVGDAGIGAASDLVDAGSLGLGSDRESVGGGAADCVGIGDGVGSVVSGRGDLPAAGRERGLEAPATGREDAPKVVASFPRPALPGDAFSRRLEGFVWARRVARAARRLGFDGEVEALGGGNAARLGFAGEPVNVYVYGDGEVIDVVSGATLYPSAPSAESRARRSATARAVVMAAWTAARMERRN